jgi:hypothetical protein
MTHEYLEAFDAHQERVAAMFKRIGDDLGSGSRFYSQSQLDAAVAAERERCATVCEQLATAWGWCGDGDPPSASSGMEACADAIRELT